jgi:3-oxoacyl-(acyl-carrier-protein) synthase
MVKHRVVVTGMSLITPIGINLEEFQKNSKKGQSGITQVDWFDIPYSMSKIAGVVRDFKPESLSTFEDTPGEDRALLFAVEATTNALIHANYHRNNLNKCSFYFSSAVAQLTMMERIFCAATKSGTQDLQPLKKPQKEKYKTYLFDDLIYRLSKHFSFKSNKLLIPTGCAGGLDAIGYAMHAIRNGKSEIVVTGAAEAPITPLVVAAFSKIGATSTKFNHTPTKASRPFDVDRDGFVLGEGCGILILESYEHALKRGAEIYAELTGTGSVNNSFHMTDIPEEGKDIARACWLAIQDAGIKPEEIDFISAHGSSTPQNDVAETNAYRSIFGEYLKKIPVTSIKSLIGHAFAASNVIEVISAILTLNHNIIPPTINLKNQDKRCDLDVVNTEARSASVNCILKSSSGFSGIHSSLVIQKFKG